MKIIHGTPGIGSALSEKDSIYFIKNSKLNLRLATIDEKGDPIIHPVWYYFEDGKLYVITGKTAKKSQNISKRDTVYFCIDEEKNIPRGVRGKARAKIIEDRQKAIAIAQKLASKYTGDLENDVAKMFVEMVKTTPVVLLELEPRYLATWNHGG